MYMYMYMLTIMSWSKNTYIPICLTVIYKSIILLSCNIVSSPGKDGFSVTKVTVGVVEVVGVVGADTAFLVAMGTELGTFDSIRVRMGLPSTILNDREGERDRERERERERVQHKHSN